jgi:hypothetical protein
MIERYIKMLEDLLLTDVALHQMDDRLSIFQLA